jgi:hypothetical protein
MRQYKIQHKVASKVPEKCDEKCRRVHYFQLPPGSPRSRLIEVAEKSTLVIKEGLEAIRKDSRLK